MSLWRIRRALHTMPKYPFSETDGLCPFLTAKTTDLIHSLHRNHLQKVNHSIMGGPLASHSLYQLIDHIHLDASQSLLLHHASQAWNIDFWMQGLQPSSGSANSPIPALRQAIERDFGSLEGMIDEFNISARSILASGWTWLVRRPNGHLSIFNTYNSGNPVYNNRSLMDKNTTPLSMPPSPSSDGNKSVSVMLGLKPATQTEVASPDSDGFVVPVLGLNMWEHAWIQDYGTHKEDYIDNFWKCANWNRVAVILNLY